MKPTLEEIEIVARQAGVILRQGYGDQIKIGHKGVIDLVTEMDHRAEAYILEALEAKYPDHRLIAEESGAQGDGSAQVWYIDPLDGTVNYAHGVPIFSVSIAYAERDYLKFGVVYDPMRDECFSAARGEGARLNGDPIRASSQSDLGQSLLVTGFPYDIRTNPENNLDNYARFALRSLGVRRLGSAALDLCYVACGRFDGYWELRMNAWDVAAGGLIAQEAGARVTAITGEADFLGPQPSILAANASLHREMLTVLHE